LRKELKEREALLANRPKYQTSSDEDEILALVDQVLSSHPFPEEAGLDDVGNDFPYDGDDVFMLEDGDDLVGFGDTEERYDGKFSSSEEEYDVPNPFLDIDRVAPESNLSVKESTTLLFAYAIRHKLSMAALADLLILLRLHLSEQAKLPFTEYRLEKNLNVDMTNVTKLYYCDNCEHPVQSSCGKDICAKCKTAFDVNALQKEGKYFLMFDVRRSLESLLKVKEVSSSLVTSLTKRSQRKAKPSKDRSYKDIVDGDCYRKLNLGENDVTCTINTDGVNVFKSSNFSLWPIYLSLNELPYKLRRKHTKLVGLWFGKSKPSFTTFLTPFVEQCNSLSEEGLSWEAEGVKLQSKVFFTIVAADSVARAPLQGLKQYNGSYSCPKCLNKGQSHTLFEGGNKWIFLPGVYAVRNKRQFLRHVKVLQKQLSRGGRQDCFGVNNFSPFLHLLQFDIVKGFIIDYMHTGLLGVLRRITFTLISSQNSNQDFYLGPRSQDLINARLAKVKIPSEVNRTMRDLNEIAKWKANEWKVWMLVCVPILNGILEERYLLHLCQLVVGLLLLLGDDILPEEINFAEELLIDFNRTTLEYYSADEMTYNNHLLTHAADCVRDWGPLWAYSLFQFENANGVLGDLFQGTRVVGMQIVKKVIIIQELRSTGSSCMTNSKSTSFMESLMDNKAYHAKFYRCRNGVTFLGVRKKYTLNDEEKKILLKKQYSVPNIENIWSYRNMLLNGKKFSKSDSSKINDCVVEIYASTYIVRQLLLLEFNDATSSAVCFVNKVDTAELTSEILTPGIMKVTGIKSPLQVYPCNLINPSKFVTIYNEDCLTHICKLPNRSEVE
jgi:Transposase family tnp2